MHRNARTCRSRLAAEILAVDGEPAVGQVAPSTGVASSLTTQHPPLMARRWVKFRNPPPRRPLGVDVSARIWNASRQRSWSLFCSYFARAQVEIAATVPPLVIWC